MPTSCKVIGLHQTPPTVHRCPLISTDPRRPPSHSVARERHEWPRESRRLEAGKPVIVGGGPSLGQGRSIDLPARASLIIVYVIHQRRIVRVVVWCAGNGIEKKKEAARDPPLLTKHRLGCSCCRPWPYGVRSQADPYGRSMQILQRGLHFLYVRCSSLGHSCPCVPGNPALSALQRRTARSK